MALNYLVAQSLYRKIACSDLPLTALVPPAIAHSHPLFVDTVRVQAPLADQLESKIETLSANLKSRLPKNIQLIEYLESTDNVTLEKNENKLVLGMNDLVSTKAEVYWAYWKMHSSVRHLVQLAIKNTADSPQEFFKHVTFAVRPDIVTKAEAELNQAINVVETFLRADECPDKTD